MQDAHPLETYRKSQNPPKSKAELARELSVSKTTITRWEKRLRKIADNLVPKIAKKTGIPPQVLRPDLAILLDGAQ